MDEITVTHYILIGIGTWITLLSFFVFKATNHYRKLGRGENISDLGKILESIVNQQNLHSDKIKKLAEHMDNYQRSAKVHFAKYALIRFNPFEESGGDQSFTIALLDSNNSGIVLSSLHSRSGTRIYAKEVVVSKATNHKFSKEEKEAVEKAAQHAPNIKRE